MSSNFSTCIQQAGNKWNGETDDVFRVLKPMALCALI